jgi:glycosyltransferase involved in cell wall biosynthesis
MSSAADLHDEPLPRARAAAAPVAVLMSRFPAVTETFILREMIEMERQGQPVRLVPMLKNSPPVIHDAAKPWTDRALYTGFLSAGIVAANVTTLLRHPLRYCGLLLRLLFGTILSPEIFVRTLALWPKSVFLARQLTSEGIRHIHAHYATHPATMALIASKFSDITFSFTVHAHDIFVNRRLLRWKLRETRFVRSISDYNRQFLERLYPNEAAGKITVIHVGITPETYERTAARLGQPSRDETPRILTVAAHKPYKGLPVLIEACARLRDEGVAFECNIIGHGPMHDELQALIDRRQLQTIVHLLGARSQDDVARMMAEATLFALPSIVAPDGQMEGIPVALMEAMASGRAVVSTTISGIPELIEHGVNGLLVPPNDVALFADAIRILLDDRERAEEMGKLGQEKVRAEFDIERCVAALCARLELELA